LQQPCTVGYRHHANNAIRNLEPMADGILALARTERAGEYPGGQKRRRDRRACIGGIALSWAISYCLRAGRWRTALRLLLGTAPMAAAAVGKKLKSCMRKPTQSTVSSRNTAVYAAKATRGKDELLAVANGIELDQNEP
jgi:hypothetical protein